jgi:hypothetical protein
MKNFFRNAGRVALCALFLFQLIRAQPVAAQILTQVKTVFVIALENHNFTQPVPTSSPEQILNNAAAPYLNSLITPGNANAAQVSYCTKYYNAGAGVHPSEPNYIWSEAGTDFGFHADTDPSVSAGNVYGSPHLSGQLQNANITWKSYQEDLEYDSSGAAVTKAGTIPGGKTNIYNGSTSYSYAPKHNPMMFFSDTWTKTANIVAMTNLIPDISSGKIGRYNWITPDLYNDMHSALSSGFTYHGTHYTGDQSAIAVGDNCLSILIPQIMATAAYQDHGVIIINMDETEGGDTTSYTVSEILISPMAKGNAYASSVVMSHSSDLKTMEEIFGLSYLNNAIPAGETAATGGYNTVSSVNDLIDLFAPVPGIVVQQPAGVNLSNGVSAVSFGTVNLGSSSTNLFTVTNSGNAALTLTNVVVIGANAGNFAVSGITLPASVAAGAATTFTVVFSPATSGASSATLQITNNDSSHDPFTVALAGRAIAAPTLIGGQIQSNGILQLTFTGPPGQTYEVLATGDLTVPLTNWTVLGSGVFGNTNALFTDSNSTNLPAQFYSIKSP